VAKVYVPVPQNGDPSTVLVTEHNPDTDEQPVVVWRDAAFVRNGVPGVNAGAMASKGEYTGAAVVMTVTGGQFEFTLTAST
jgi:hypothetical protein